MTLVEQVARALYRQRAPSLGPLETSEDRGWRHYAADARAAITAMREETDAMNDAMAGQCDGGQDEESCRCGYMGKIWRAGIDAALKE